jgi:hypothetical protein
LDEDTAVRGSDSAVSGLRPGTWVGTRSAYDEARKRQGRRTNGSTPPPKSDYKLLIASHRINGAEYRLAYADGAAPTLNPRTPMLARSNPDIDVELARPPEEEDFRTARELEGIVAALASNHRFAMTVETIIQTRGFREDDGDHVLRALEAAELSALIGVDGAPPGRRSRLLPLLDPERRQALEQATLALTHAGLVWHQSTRAMQIGRDRRRVIVTGGKDQSINFTGVFSGPVTAARGDIRGNRISQVQTNGLSEDAVLAYLRLLLESRALDWNSEELAPIRPVIRDAIEQAPTSDPKLARAMKYPVSKQRHPSQSVGRLCYDRTPQFLYIAESGRLPTIVRRPG